LIEMAIRAVLFDVYGTLLDVHSAIAREGRDLGPAADSVSRLWRQKQLEYTWVYSLRGEYRGFRDLTAAALDFALTDHDVAPGLRERLLRAYEQLSPYSDAVGALAQLRGKGLRLAALSNGDPDMLETGLSSARLRAQLDAVLSVAPLKVYKPDRRVYELGRDWADAAVGDIAFISSNAWDAGGAAAFGFRTFWINRGSQPPEYDIGATADILGSLSDLPARLT
jgi:2-haloacid dehalogenase